MSHHESDIRTALETSPAVRKAVAAMLAALGEARECGVYSFTDTCDYEHTVETRFAKYQQAVKFQYQIIAVNNAVDKWIMESRDDDMDANGQTVTVWTGQMRYGTSTSFGIVGTKEEAIEWVETQEDVSGIIWEDFEDGKGGLITRVANDAGIRTLLVVAYEVTLPATPQPPAAPPPADSEDARPQSLAKELAALLNKHGIDNATNTYDFVLAGYLVDCITAFKKARNTDTSLRWLEPANQPAEAASVDALAKGNGDGGYSDYAAARGTG